MSRISTGTVSVDAGGTVVTLWQGDGGVFLSNITAPAGSQIVIEGVANFIKTRLSTTSVELELPHAGAGGENLPCAISALTGAETSVGTLNARTATVIQQLSVLDANGRGLFYNLIGVTGDNDPGPGNMALDNVDPELVSEIYLDVLDANEGGRDVSALIELWQAKTIIVVRSLASTAFVAFRLSGTPEDATGYRRLPVEYVGHDGALSDEPVAIEWRLSGADRDVDQTVNVIADRAAFDSQLAGFSVMVNGPGRAARYTRITDVPGVWSSPAYYTGEQSTVPGPIGINWRPAWDAVTTYALRDGVEDNGSSWRSLQDNNLNHAPPVLPVKSNAWWTLISAKGMDGTGTGDMVGPVSSTDGGITGFSGTTGKLAKELTPVEARGAMRAGILSGFRNWIINPNFDYWIRGTSFANPGAQYTADRWGVGGGGAGSAYSAERAAYAVNDGGMTYALKMIQTAGAGSIYAIHKIEDVRNLAGKRVTISVFARNGGNNPNIAVRLDQAFGSGGSSTVSTTQQVKAITTSDARYDFVIDVPTIVGKVIGANSHLVLYIFNGSGGANTYPCNLFVGRVSLVEGEVSAHDDPFATRHPQQELALCRRYARIASVPDLIAASASTLDGGMDVSDMRVTPAASLTAAMTVSDVTTTTFTQSSAQVSLNGASTNGHLRLTFANFSGMTLNRPYRHQPSSGLLLLDAEI